MTAQIPTSCATSGKGVRYYLLCGIVMRNTYLSGEVARLVDRAMGRESLPHCLAHSRPPDKAGVLRGPADMDNWFCARP